MIISSPTGGLAAYQAALSRPVQESASNPTTAPGAEFSGLVSNMLAEVRQSGAQANVEITRSVAGQGDLIATATAVNSAELALETLVAVRDRMVAAYNDVMRMQI